MGQAITLPFQLVSTTLTFYRGFFYYLVGPGRTSPYLPPQSQSSSSSSENTTTTANNNNNNNLGSTNTTPAYLRPPPEYSNPPAKILFYQNARIHLYALASEFYLYHRPHYRKPSYRLDLLDNLSNVAIPGTGVPLSYMVIHRSCAFFLVLVVYPAVSLLAAVHLAFLRSTKGGGGFSSTNVAVVLADEYSTRLLAPDDWFSLWRLNSKIAALHSHLRHVPEGYAMENKWTFLEEGTRRGVPVSPYLAAPAGIVVKHRNEEGGMGIHFYRNACHGGDWILQERMNNGRWVADHLPEDAPLSTFRVVTQSRGALTTATTTEDNKRATALSCVFRAGRAGASTDHVAIMFDVDVATGAVRRGSTNSHWYRLGWTEWLRCPWRSGRVGLTHHPDGNIPLTGEIVPNIREMLSLVEESHEKLCPDVPLVGWDVVCSSDEKLPICLLEVNLSCNFFMGSFDKKVYLDFLEDLIGNLQELRLKADREEEKKVR